MNCLYSDRLYRCNYLFFFLITNVDGRNRFKNQSNWGSAKMSDIPQFLHKKRKVNAILRKVAT